MKNISIPPFYVGQEVVSVWDHSEGDFKKGDEFKVTSISIGCCGFIVTIGIRTGRTTLSLCPNCKKTHLINGNEYEYDASCFRAKIEISEFISMKQVVEEGLELISAN